MASLPPPTTLQAVTPAARKSVRRPTPSRVEVDVVAEVVAGKGLRDPPGVLLIRTASVLWVAAWCSKLDSPV